MIPHVSEQGIPLRERLGQIWRWPLYSRVRFGGTLTAVVIVVLALPSPGADADSSGGADSSAVTPSVTWYTTSSTTRVETSTTGGPVVASSSTVVPGNSLIATAPTTGAVAATSPITTSATAITTFPVDLSTFSSGDSTTGPATAEQAPPDLAPAAGDYTSPASVATRYLRAWCYAPASSPANTNIASAAPWMTAAGWKDDKTRAVTDESWAATRNAGITTMCGPVTVDEIPAAPNTDTVHWVALSADRTYYDATGLPLSTETLNQTRQVVLVADGRWLVDIQSAAS